MNRFHRFLSTTAAAALTLAVAACGDATGPEGTTSVAFRAATSSASASVTSGDISFSHSGDTDAPTISADGTNGQLTIADVHFIMSEFELERADEAEDCDDEAASEEACEEFEAEMQFLELPLTGDAAVAVQQTVPAGDYDELEFSIEELEADEEDDEAGQIDQLLTDIRENHFADWPSRGSVRIHGTFTPKDDQGNLLTDQARDFTAYFEAEVEIEKEFDSPMQVADGSNNITVTVDPTIWFERGDGTVVDLSQYDFDPEAGGPIPEFEVETESSAGESFTEIEHDG